jgi:hypothetical protein
MANIQIKRSTGSTAPTSAQLGLAGELGWIDGTGGNGSLYVKNAANGAVMAIGGAPGGLWGLALLDGTALTGTTTMAALTGGAGAFDLTAGTVTVATAAANVNDTTAASTAYVTTAVSNASPDMDDIGDTDLANGGAVTDASVLIYDALTSKWEDQRIGSGASHVTVNKDGVATITDYPSGLFNMGSDTTGGGFIKSVAAANATSIVVAQNGGNADGDTVALSLASDVTIPNNLTVGGNLIVSGTSTEVNTNTIELEDPMLVLGDGSASTAGDRGIELRYSVGGSPTTGFFGLDNDLQKFAFYKTAVVSNNEVDTTAVGTVLGDAVFGNITGTLTTASQTAITGVGTITTGVWESSNKIGEAFGGTNIDTTNGNGNSDGVATVTAGGWSVEANLDVGYGGTGVSTFTSKGILYGNGTGALQVTALGTDGQFMKAGSGGTPEWSDTVDGGTF